uniref:Uncharacterized protein n=1 Tax=Cannabis sativa TaxID=3483 RepID=A0A803QRF6_CANSA
IWNLMEFSFLHEVKEEIDFKNVLLYASELVEREAFAKFIICSWAIWTEKNKITHGQQIRQPQFVVEWIISYYESIFSMKEGSKKVPKLMQGVGELQLEFLQVLKNR